MFLALLILTDAFHQSCVHDHCVTIKRNRHLSWFIRNKLVILTCLEVVLVDGLGMLLLRVMWEDKKSLFDKRKTANIFFQWCFFSYDKMFLYTLTILPEYSDSNSESIQYNKTFNYFLSSDLIRRHVPVLGPHQGSCIKISYKISNLLSVYTII